jgi:hypothetical protein
MPRKPRIEYPGACYHVMRRGVLGISAVDLKEMKKTDPRKQGVAWLIKTRSDPSVGERSTGKDPKNQKAITEHLNTPLFALFA